MKNIGSTLFYGGLLVAIAGFVGDKAESFPWALRVLAPSYVAASQGLEALQSKGTLSDGEPGFSQLERIFRAEAEARGVGAGLYFQRVTKFERKTAMITLGEARAGEVVPVEIHLTAGKANWDMAGLRDRTEDLKRSSLLRFSIFVFSIGLCLAVTGRIIETRSTKPNKALQPTGADDGTGARG